LLFTFSAAGTDGADARRDCNRQEVVIAPQTDGMPVT